MYRVGVPLLVFACGIQDPGNLGAIIRTAEAAGATGLVTMSAGADPYGWKALRGSMGSALRLPIVVATDVVQAIEDAKMHGCRLMGAVSRGGACYRDTDFSQPTAIAVGGEGQGLSDEVLGALDQRVSVPMAPPVESLNTAVTAALLLFEAEIGRAHV